jgi:hypothetical protein
MTSIVGTQGNDKHRGDTKNNKHKRDAMNDKLRCDKRINKLSWYSINYKKKKDIGV